MKKTIFVVIRMQMAIDRCAFLLPQATTAKTCSSAVPSNALDLMGKKAAGSVVGAI